MSSIPLYRLMDALSKLPPEFSDQNSKYAEVPNILPIVSDFLSDYLQVEGMLDTIESKLAALSPEGRRIFLLIIGVLVNGGPIPVLTQAKGFKPAKFADKVILGTLVEVSESLGKLVLPAQISGDQDRAEELCRKIARALDLLIDGEDAEESKTRLFQLDTIELDKVQQEVERKIQKALEEARAREAAAKPSGE
jgi:hypothetical protein